VQLDAGLVARVTAIDLLFLFAGDHVVLFATAHALRLTHALVDLVLAFHLPAAVFEGLCPILRAAGGEASEPDQSR